MHPRLPKQSHLSHLSKPVFQGQMMRAAWSCTHGRAANLDNERGRWSGQPNFENYSGDGEREFTLKTYTALCDSRNFS